MQVSTHNQDTPAANKQHKIEDQLPEYFNHGRILAPLAGIIPDLSFNLVGHHGSHLMIFLKKKNRSHNGASLWKGCKPWCPTRLKDKSGIIPARGASILPWLKYSGN